MNVETATEKAINELQIMNVFMPHHINIVRRYLCMMYTIGHDEGSRSRSKRIPVIQMDKYGNEIERFESASAAARKIGGDRSNINKCCSGKIHEASGFLWKQVI